MTTYTGMETGFQVDTIQPNIQPTAHYTPVIRPALPDIRSKLTLCTVGRDEPDTSLNMMAVSAKAAVSSK